MGVFAQAVARKSIGPMDLFRDMLSRGTTASGKTVNEKTALEVATVFACLRVRANGVSQVPLKLMRESADGRSRLPAKDHPLYSILETRPNDWQTSFEYRETLMLHLGLCNEHFSFVNRSNRAGIMELIPFEPGRVTVKRDKDYTLTYDVQAESGSVQTFPAKAIWHVRGPSWNSWTGIPAVQIAREAIGLAMATEEQQARMQKNGVRASGVYSVDGTLGDQQYKTLRKWIDDEIGGVANAGKAMLLDRGAKWLNTSMTGVDAQTLETRRFQVEELCRALGVNPIMVFAESKNTTYASAAQMFLAHVVHTVAPDYSRLEQSINANLLTDADRAAGLYANFVEEGLLRGSMVETKETLLGYTNGGLMTPNEARAKLDMNPDPDPASDKLRIPANITGTVPDAQQPKGTP
jgi:HK97 family phage portal protein